MLTKNLQMEKELLSRLPETKKLAIGRFFFWKVFLNFL